MNAITSDNIKKQKTFDVHKIRADFPILNQRIRDDKQLVYLDNAATSQKPKIVIDTINNYYNKINANVHRGIHCLSEAATHDFEETRQTVKNFLNASAVEEIIYVKGTTEGINLVASSYGRKNIKKGDEVVISAMEHHSNIVPWQILCEEKGAMLKIIPINDDGEILIEEYEKLLNEKTKFVSINHISNTLGTINPVKKVIESAHKFDVPVLLDGAQAAPHLTIDVQELDCDFFVFSGHKAYGPTGIGVLYGKKELLEAMPPYQGGGEMIDEVKFEKTTYNDLPYKFEAGTPNIADAIALKQALEYTEKLGKEAISAYEDELLKYATEALRDIKGLKIIGTAKEKVSVISFVLDGIHHQDVGILLDAEGIAVRTGHHCTMPLMDRFNISGTARASFAFYNTKSEVDLLVEGIYKVIKMFK